MTCIERNVDHGSDDGRCIGAVISPVDAPLIDDQKVHIAEEESHEAELWQKLAEKIKISTEVESVGCFYKNTEDHVHHTDYNRDLHFERVGIDEVVLCDAPYWIETEGIDATCLLRDRLACLDSICVKT